MKKKIRIGLECCNDYFTVISINLLTPLFIVVLLMSTRLSIFCTKLNYNYIHYRMMQHKGILSTQVKC